MLLCCLPGRHYVWIHPLSWACLIRYSARGLFTLLGNSSLGAWSLVTGDSHDKLEDNMFPLHVREPVISY